MALEDRVITTEQLIAANSGQGVYLQLGDGLLRQLDPLGVHVLVPAGPLPGSDQNGTLCCEAHLRIAHGDDELVVPTVLSFDDFVGLPTAFEALSIAAQLVPAMVAEINLR